MSRACRNILFQGPMVVAIGEDRKTVTRRVSEALQFDACLTGDCPHWDRSECETELMKLCRYGVAGDLLRVRETWQYNPHGGIVYRAGSGIVDCDGRGWRPSIFMPNKVARHYLEILAVRIERVQEITEEEAAAEGFIATGNFSARNQFIRAWVSMYSKPREVKEGGKVVSYISYPWAEGYEVMEHRGLPWYVYGNPWVWVVEFKKTDARP